MIGLVSYHASCAIEDCPTMKNQKQISARIDPALVKKFKAKLASCGCTYREWLVEQIIEFLRKPPSQDNK